MNTLVNNTGNYSSNIISNNANKDKKWLRINGRLYDHIIAPVPIMPSSFFAFWIPSSFFSSSTRTSSLTWNIQQDHVLINIGVM